MKTVPKARHTFSLFALNFSLLTAGKLGTPEGTRTPDLLLRSIGQGIFEVIFCPFGALWWGILRVAFSLAASLPYRFFLFWVRIWVKF